MAWYTPLESITELILQNIFSINDCQLFQKFAGNFFFPKHFPEMLAVGLLELRLRSPALQFLTGEMISQTHFPVMPCRAFL